MRKPIIYLSVVLLLSGCQMNTPADKLDDSITVSALPKESVLDDEFTRNVQHYLDQIEDNRIPDTLTFDEELKKAYDVPFDLDTYLSDMETAISTEYNYQIYNPRKRFSTDYLMEDTNLLFSLLKTLYGPYPYIGEEAFTQAQKEIVAIMSQYTYMTYEEYSILLRSRLSFVNDWHFTIDYEHVSNQNVMYREQYVDYDDVMFYKEQDRYYRYDYDTPLIAIDDDENLDTYLHPMLHNEDGTIGYQLYLSLPSSLKYYDVELRFENQDVLTVPIEETQNQNALHMYNTFEPMEDIPYVHIMNMPYSSDGVEFGTAASKFLEQADVFRDSPYAILDLRGNGGGNAMLSYQWSYRFSQQLVSGFSTRILRLPFENETINTWGNDNGLAMDVLHRYADYVEYAPGTYVDYGDSQLYGDGDTMLFVLQDENSVSAAEMLIDQLHTIRNVVFVGMPTGGAIQSSTMKELYLPNTNMEVQFGNLYALYDVDYGMELQGIQPDIWVPSDDALDYTVAFIKNLQQRDE